MEEKLAAVVLGYAGTELVKSVTKKMTKSAKSSIQKELFGKDFKGWSVYGMSYLAYCELGL